MGILRTFRKMLITLPLAAVAFFVVPLTNNIQTNDQLTSFREASAATPFRTINNSSDMESFLSECASDTGNTTFKKKLVVLNSDVFISITSAATAGGFGGEFNGNGHTVTVTINYTSSNSAVGMFRNIWSTGNVHDLNIAGSVICNDFAAPLAVYNIGTIKDCSSSVTIDLPLVQHVAGFVSVNQGGTIDNCTFSGTLSGAFRTGGIAYRNNVNGTKIGSITNCTNNGSISSTEYASGICAYCDPNCVITNCTNEGDISGQHYVSGIVAINNGTTSNCINEGSITATGTASSGVISYNYGYVTNCVNNGDVSTSDGRIAGVCYRNVGTVENCTNNGSVSSTKYIAGGLIAILGEEPTEAADPYPATYVYNCVNTGTISGLRSCSGIAAYVLPNASIYYCSNYGNVTCSEVAKEPKYGSGGVVGTMNKNNTKGGTHSDDGVITEVVGCYSSGDITAASCAGGLIGLITSDMSPTVAVKGCLSTGDISNPDTAYGYAGTFMGYSIKGKLSITDSWSTGAMKTTGSNHRLGIGGGSANSTSYSKTNGTSTDFKDVIKDIRCFECESISGFGDLYDGLSSDEKELLSTLVYYHPTYTQSYDSAAHYISSYSASSGLSRLSYSFNGNDKTISVVFIITISTTTLFLTFIMMRTIKNKRKNNH